MDSASSRRSGPATAELSELPRDLGQRPAPSLLSQEGQERTCSRSSPPQAGPAHCFTSGGQHGGGGGQRSWGPKDSGFGENETEKSEVGAGVQKGRCQWRQGQSRAPASLCSTGCPHREEEEGGLGCPSATVISGCSPSLELRPQPWAWHGVERPSQLLLPAVTRLTSLLSGKWCFD